MPIPFARPVALSDDTRGRLQLLALAASTPQALAFRCRLLLRTAQPDQPTNGQIAAELHCDRHTVGLWRNRFLDHGLAGLQDAPRPGRPRAFSPARPYRGLDHRLGKHGRS